MIPLAEYPRCATCRHWIEKSGMYRTGECHKMPIRQFLPSADFGCVLHEPRPAAALDEAAIRADERERIYAELRARGN